MDSPGQRLAASLERVTLGASPLGKNPEIADDFADALLTAPFRQIDTSNNYSGGESERALGRAIARAGGLQPGVVVFSKADADPVTGAFSGDRIRRSFDESRERLGLDVLPLYHFHDPYGMTVAEAMAPGGPVEALAQLRDEGSVGAIGIAAGRRALVEEYVRTDAFDAVLIHNRFTLVDRSAGTVFDLATERGMAVFNAAPFGGGLLAGSTTRGRTYAYTEPSEEFLAFVDRVRALADEWDVDLAAAAVQFAASDPRVHSVVVGVSSRERVVQLSGLVAADVPADFWDAFDALGSPPPSPAD